MDRNELQALIDRVIGKKGILRAPSYWMRRVFSNLMDYADGKAEEANAYTDNAVKNVKVEVDNEMSDESENAVSNKVIKAYIDSGTQILNEGIKANAGSIVYIIDKLYGSPMYIEALEDMSLSIYGEAQYYYSRDMVTWDRVSNPTTITQGEKIYLKAENVAASNVVGSINTSGRYNAGGHITSMLYGEDYYKHTSLEGHNNAFMSFFTGTKIVDASQLVLPSDTTSYCYAYMFKDCAELIYAPACIPAEIISSYACESMYENCTSLEETSELPATRIYAGGCYGMYKGCTSLKRVSAMTITSVGMSSMAYMFEDCTSLESAPMTLNSINNSCYQGMFRNCTSLKEAPELPVKTTKSDAYDCYSSMFAGCTSLETAPTLPIETLQRRMYQSMFYGCSSLNKITMLATNTSGTNCLTSWVSGVATTGTFIKAKGVTLPTGVNGIPEGWTVEEVEV